MRVVLTGARGNLGQAFVDFFKLHKINYIPLYWNSFSLGQLYKEFEDGKVTHFVNCAALSSRDISRLEPGKTYESNVCGVWKILEMIRLYSPACRFVNFGTIYEEEDDFSPYTSSKRMARELIKSYREEYKLFAFTVTLGLTEYYTRKGSFLTQKIIKGAVEIARKIKTGKDFESLNIWNIYDTYKFCFALDIAERVWELLNTDYCYEDLLEGEEINLKQFIEEVFKSLDIEGHWFKFHYFREEFLLTTKDYTCKCLVRADRKFSTKKSVTFPVQIDEEGVKNLKQIVEETKWRPKTLPQEMIRKLVEHERNKV